jgi:hypothetical protein
MVPILKPEDEDLDLEDEVVI